jgi:23S rRNA (uracil1939-C5)-methyltransferase
MRAQEKLKNTEFAITIESLNHEGKGVAHRDNKVVFIDGALPGEEVLFRYTKRKRSFDEGKAVEIISASNDRVDPKCAHFGVCGGCSLQHMDTAAQILAKQNILLDNFTHIGKVKPEHVLAPVTGECWAYRRKARLGVKYVIKKERVLVGFREKRSPYLADLQRCEVLHPSVGERLTELGQLIAGLKAYNKIAQIEVAVSDDFTALVFRNLIDLCDEDIEILRNYAQQENLHIYLQPKGPDTIYPLWPEDSKLQYTLEEFDITIDFLPSDFTQVNNSINQQMIPYAINLLDLNKSDVILDLFSGLGNFSLPMAKTAARVVGVEGEKGLVERAKQNAANNGIENVEFHVANLAEDISIFPWAKQTYNKILLDPPRSGAIEVLPMIGKTAAHRLVYVSCNPATLARDAGELVNQYGYRLISAGVMDMFPHTAHVESIALFERDE